MDFAHSRIRSQALFREPFVEPGQRRGELRILIAKPMHEFDRESLGKGLHPTSGENGRRRLRGAPAYAKQSIRKAIGLVARGAAAGELLRKPPQILDQDDLQGYRNRPKLTDREGLNLKPAVGPVIGAVAVAFRLHQPGASRGGARRRRPLRNAWKARERMARHFCIRVNCSAFCARPRRKTATAASARAAGLALA